MCFTRRDIPDGLIEVDSEWGRRLGFTADVFVPNGQFGSQLFKRGDDMYIQTIQVVRPNHGCLNLLLARFWDLGFTVKVPNPIPRMLRILKKKGFAEISEQALTHVEPNLDSVWIKSPPRLTPPASP